MLKIKRARSISAIIAMIFMFSTIFSVPIPTIVNAATQATYYVDTATGNNNNNGTSIGSAWQTIQKARDYIRVNKGSMNGDIIVYLRGGTYQLSSTLAFNENDSGNNNYNIIYTAYTNEEPVISGVQR